MVGGGVDAAAVRAGTAAPPAQPGVYAFRDARGALLYVGTSRDLGARVRSYFAPGHPPLGKAARIARLAARVEWRTCGSVLEALVLEVRTIQRRRPHFNRRLTRAGSHAYVCLDPRDPFPRLEVARAPAGAAVRYVGPFPGGRRLAAAVDRVADALGLRTCAGPIRVDPDGRACVRLDLGRCAAPCVGHVTAGAYGRQVARALAALGGTDPAVARRAGARSGPPPAVLLGAVAGALRALRAARIAARVLVVVQAAGAPGHRLLAVGGGLLRTAVAAPEAAALPAAFARAVGALAPPAPELLACEQLDEVRVVTGWLATGAGRAAAIDLDRVGRERAWARVAARVAAGPLFALSSGDRSGRA